MESNDGERVTGGHRDRKSGVVLAWHWALARKSFSFGMIKHHTQGPSRMVFEGKMHQARIKGGATVSSV